MLACNGEGLAGSTSTALTLGQSSGETRATTTSGADELGDEDGPEPGDDEGDTQEGETGTIKFDMAIPDGGSAGCAPPEHTPCDGDGDIFHAIGINCPGEPQFSAAHMGHPDSFLVHSGAVGTYDPPTYPVLEGEQLLILSNGVAADLLDPGAVASTSTAFDGPILELPVPILVDPVDPSGTNTCTEDPSLIGTGDCSNTIESGWAGNFGAWNYVELRLGAQVPVGVDGLSYDFAFFTTEYPEFYSPGGGFGTYNDLYIAWLESEQWTGNISFDEQGSLISVNTSLFDYKDAPNDFDCPDCSAPELEGTALEGHGATKWLTTRVGVVPGEDIELVLALMDMQDPIWDSMVIVDNFRWTCDAGPPFTIPK